MKTWPTEDGKIEYSEGVGFTWIGFKANELRAWIRTTEFLKQACADDALLCKILDDTLEAAKAHGRSTL